MSLTRVTALDGDTILPLADAKAHLRVRHADEDDLIASLRDAAILHVERVSGVPLEPTEFMWRMRCFRARIDLPRGPVTELGDVSYYDSEGEVQTYADARLIDGAVYPAASGSWPHAYGYAAVEFTAGLTEPSEGPDLLAAIKLLTTHFYENRSAVNVGNITSELPLAVHSLIGAHVAVLA